MYSPNTVQGNRKDGDFFRELFSIFPDFVFTFFPLLFLLWLLLGVQGQGTKRQSQRDGE